MQASRASFYVERFGRNALGLFPKWRPLEAPIPGTACRFDCLFPLQERKTRRRMRIIIA